MFTRTIYAASERLISGVGRVTFNPGVVLAARKKEEAVSMRKTDNGSTEHTLCGSGVAAANAGLRKFSECATPLSRYESEQFNVG